MASTQGAFRRRAFNAVALIARTIRTLRQHKGVPRLLENSLSRCRRELAELLADEDLAMELHVGQVFCAGQAVLRFDPGDVPFGLLFEAGVGEMVLARGHGADEIERMIRICATAQAVPEQGYDLASALNAGDLPGLHLRPPSEAQRVGRVDGPRIDWWLLPEPMPRPALIGCIERDLQARLPARALALLLTDLERGGCDQPPGPLLESLLDAMLAQGDTVGAAQLLEQADHRARLPIETALRLRRRALQAFDGGWLLAQLDDEQQLQGLVSLALQLGDESIDRLASAANAAGIPLPPMLASLLPPGE